MSGGNSYLAKNRNSKLFYGYIIVVATFFIMAVANGATYTFGVFFKPLLTEFGWSRATISGAPSLSMLVGGLLGIGVGRLTDRFGPRLLVVGGGFFLGLGYLLMSQTNAIWQLYLFYGVIRAIGMSGLWVPLVSTVARWFVKRRGLMSGIVFAGIGVGAMAMPPLANRLISAYGWRISYIIIGITVLVIIVLAGQFLRRNPSQIEQLSHDENEAKERNLNLQAEGFSLREAIHTRQLWILGGMFFCVTFIIMTITVHIVPHITDLGISTASAASILAIIGGVSIAGRIIIGSAADRIGSRLTIISVFVLLSASLFWLIAAKELWMFYLFAVIFGFTYIGVIVLQPLLVAELFGLRALGVIIAIVDLGSTTGAAIGPVLTGYIFDVADSYQLAFLICAGVSIIGLILSLLLRPIINKGGGNDPRRST
ncbi:L-lactate transporter [subsurface metagenome]